MTRTKDITMSRAFLTGLLLLTAASPAFAQQPAAPSLGGTQIPGVCLLSQQAVIANAKVGVAAMARLKQLTDQAQAEVEAGRKPIEADAKALEAQRASLKSADFQQKQQALGQRLQALQQTAQLRSREIEATRQKALARIAGEAQPLIAQVYKAHACGLLLDRGAVLGGNMGGDLTAAVVQAIDAKIATISFDRETLPAPTQTAAR
jgi:Skp family chaperone for outer membrane proteins